MDIISIDCFYTMFNNISSTEVIIIGIIAILVFGSSKLKDFAKGAGESAKELKKIKKELESTVKEEINKEEKNAEKGGGN